MTTPPTDVDQYQAAVEGLHGGQRIVDYLPCQSFRPERTLPQAPISTASGGVVVAGRPRSPWVRTPSNSCSYFYAYQRPFRMR